MAGQEIAAEANAGVVEKNNRDSKKQSKEFPIEQLVLMDVIKNLALEQASNSLSTLVKLDLPDCNLNVLPHEFATLFPRLQILFLPKNRFRQVPCVIGQCPQLKMISFKNNEIQSIHPEALQIQMKWLILTDNMLEELPETIGRCRYLQKCMLSGNRLTQLPSSIVRCQSLELIRLASNRLESPPMELLQLPKLNWIALANNPFLDRDEDLPHTDADILEASCDIPEIKLDHEPQIILGRGAGGITKRASYRGKHVAVKLFSGSMTSDGLPQQERRVAMTVASILPNHPALIDIVGRDIENDGALVMECLENVRALAHPPNFETCSRDVYRNETAIPSPVLLLMISRLLQVLSELHEHGICHGDFYSHNILVSSNDHDMIKLTDFGAAFFYNRKMAYAHYIERCECRAFGIWLKEMMEYYYCKNDESELLLNQLASKCTESNTSFQKIHAWWLEQDVCNNS